MKKIILFLFLLFFNVVLSEELPKTTKEEYLSGKIVQLISEDNSSQEEGVIKTENYNVKLLEGNDKGELIEVALPIYKNEEYNLNVKVGDRVVIYKTSENFENNENKIEYYISDVDKRTDLYIMSAIFIGLILLIAKKNGLKAFFALFMSVLFIIKIFIPAIYNGHSPILFAVITAIFSSIITIYFTLGVNKKFFIALLGVVGGVVASGILSYVFTYMMRINGFMDSDLLASAYLLKNINLKELVPAAVIIGSLGAVMDVAVSITSAINEIHEHNPKIKAKAMFKSGLNIGTDIIGTMINTLVLAYIASSIFTLLLIYIQANQYPLIRILNFQDIAVEIMKSICGSIGILVSVPLTAYIGTLIYKKIIKNKDWCPHYENINPYFYISKIEFNNNFV